MHHPLAGTVSLPGNSDKPSLLTSLTDDPTLPLNEEAYLMLMKGKVCVVTGAASSQGIGRATAHLLATNGAHVVIIDVSENVDSVAGGIAADHPASSTLGVKCNIVDTVSCEKAATKVSRAFDTSTP